MSQPNSIPPSNTPPSSEIPPGAAIIQKDANGRPSMFDVLKTIRLEELKLDNLAKTPCARDTLLYGIGGGLGMSVFRYWRTKNGRSAGNWGFVSFALGSIISWEICRFQRRKVLEQLDRLQVEQRPQNGMKK